MLSASSSSEKAILQHWKGSQKRPKHVVDEEKNGFVLIATNSGRVAGKIKKAVSGNRIWVNMARFHVGSRL